MTSSTAQLAHPDAEHLAKRTGEGLFTSRFAERALRITQDEGYKKALASQIRRGLVAMAVGVVGGAVSYYQLSQPLDSLHVYQFWLLCLVLAGGLFGVALLELIGSGARHLAMWRLAVGLKDQEAFEAEQETSLMESRIMALELLCREATDGSWTIEPELLRLSLEFILESRRNPDEAAMQAKWTVIARGWKQHGVDDEVLKSLRTAGVVLAAGKAA